MKEQWKHLIVALDVDSCRKAKRIVRELSPYVKKFKIGTILFTLCGPQIIEWVHSQGAEVFLDLKLFDIPNTMSKTAEIISLLEVWAFTVHLKAGEKALRAVKEAVKGKRTMVVGVTELTSTNASAKKILALASLAKQCGIKAIVCSAQEAGKIKQKFSLTTICPGIRKYSALKDDQKRVSSPQQALKSGADYLVVGRPIVAKRDYLGAAKDLWRDAV